MTKDRTMTNLTNATTPYVDHAAHERQHQERARTATSRHGRHITAVGDIFGEAAAHILTRSFEDVTEHLGEASYHLRALVGEAEDRANGLAVRLSDVSAERDSLRVQLGTALAELERRHKRSNTPPPEWVTRFRQDLDDNPF